MQDLTATYEEVDAACAPGTTVCQRWTGTFVLRNVGSQALAGVTRADATIAEVVLDFADDVGDASADRAPCGGAPWDLAPGKKTAALDYRVSTSAATDALGEPAILAGIFVPCGLGDGYPTGVFLEQAIPADGDLVLELAGLVASGVEWTASASTTVE